jgi:hypothetical protein
MTNAGGRSKRIKEKVERSDENKKEGMSTLVDGTGDGLERCEMVNLLYLFKVGSLKFWWWES